jgi:hypothetical protein
VFNSYAGRLEQEDATGRFHASLAFRREIFDRRIFLRVAFGLFIQWTGLRWFHEKG